MARKRLKAMEVTPWVLKELRTLLPENRKMQERFYLHHAQRALDWFGPLAARPRLPDGLNHIEVLLLFAGHGAQMLGASNYRAWTQAKNLLQFQRMLFLRTLVIGAGTYPSASALLHPSGGAPWGLFHDDGAAFFGQQMPRKKESNALVPASRIEQAVFHHLFPSALIDSPDAMAGLAVIGSFETPADSANPIVLSMRRAIRKCILKYRIAPGPLIEPWLQAWYPGVFEQIDEADLPAADDAQIVQDEPPEEEEGGGSPPSPKAIEDGEAQTAPHQLAARIKAGIERDEIKVSCANGPIHGFRGIPVIIWPKGVATLAEAVEARDAAEVERALIEQGWVALSDGQADADWVAFAHQQGDRLVMKGKAQVVPLTERGIEALLPASGVPDNPTMALPEEVA